LGLGWYGRSFTLADSSCNIPNGVCRFTVGANPGQCSNNAGTLTNLEIKRILASGTAIELYDETAGVKWMHWNNDQWISYDELAVSRPAEHHLRAGRGSNAVLRPRTTIGACRWEGFRGVAFPCSPACSDSNATLAARNTNSYYTNKDG
jgi:hypothetical protein